MTSLPLSQTLSRSTTILANIALFVFFGWVFVMLGADTPTSDALIFRPGPDVGEQVYVAHAMALGHNTLLPIGNNLYPSRYSPVHPFLLSLWMRLHGRNLDAVFTYSPVAVFAAFLLAQWWMALGGLGLTGRVTVFLILLASPAYLNCARNIMQDSSMPLLFVSGCLLWLAAVQQLRGDKPRVNWQIGLMLSLFAGIVHGALVCIRPVIAPLSVCAALHLLLMLRFRRFLQATAMMALGYLFVIVPVAGYVHSQSGAWNVVAYNYWEPNYNERHFNRSQPFEPETSATQAIDERTSTTEETTTSPIRLVAMWYSLTGNEPGLTSVPLEAHGLLFAGIVPLLFLLIFRPRARSEKWDSLVPFLCQLFVLILFSIFLLGVQSFYFGFHARYFLLPYLILAVSGTTGWYCLVERLRNLGRMGPWLSGVTAAGLLVALASGLSYTDHIFDNLSAKESPRRVRRLFEIEAAGHAEARKAVHALKCPLFVDRIPLLNARFSLGMTDSPYPIFFLCNEKDKYFTAELSQWPIREKLEPKGHVVSPEKWAFAPDSSWLYYPKTEFIARNRLDAAIENFGKIGIYFPTWRKADMKELLVCLNEDFEVREVECTAYSRLITVSKKPAGKKPEFESAE